MTKFKAAIIGGGHIAEQNHIPALKTLSDRVEIIAICGRDLEKTKLLTAKYGIPHAFDQPDEMYAAAAPDIIINATANNLHYPFTIQALNNNCHVLCEKPPALHADQAREMADLASSKNKVLAYNFQLRQTPEYALLSRLKQEGQLGQIYHIKAHFLRRRGIPGWGNFTNKEIQGGGALMDLGVHVLDLALGLLDYPIPAKVLANTYDYIGKKGGKGLMGTWDPATFEVEDACFAHLSFADNASIMLSAAFALNTKLEKSVNLEVFGTRGGATLHPPALYTDMGDELTDMHFNHLEETDIQLKNTMAFLDACEGKPSNICQAEEGAILQGIVERIYNSADKGGRE
ncbi:Gfo/Idh/MocA family protein [Dyadobacter sandarakinus]|uniref:Gfo/Idh/MocA family oxidoreductase n=1 Tax=Dyadobacter sandarakinus TaxID=2747268 RepID=A0ABX7IBX8_9BACT|nr:Gfo/Idh/MocA family oxidoreductase [Dyadobacter sandarakinus]QRR03223.1 Gfo/Idh/MocA family oxidoreductase [Dyadobacter sandarakinus]